MKAILFVLLTGMASAQLALYSFDGVTETPVGATYNYGSVSAASNKDVRFRAHNIGTSPVTIALISASGSGFSVSAVNGILPYPIAPANFLEFSVRFNGTVAAGYSANLQVTSTGSANISVLLLATALTPPLLTAVTGCTIGSQSAFDFGNVTIGTQHLCNFSLFNPTGTPILISTITLSSPFTFQQNPVTPVTIASNTAIAFTVIITPGCGTASYNGSLIINGQTFPLVAAGITPSLAKPTIAFDKSTFASGEQHSVSISLPSVSPCGATGNLNLAFTPNVAGVADDTAVVFVKGNVRSLQFTVPPNSSQVTIAGQGSQTFQTGTTAGTIKFTIAGPPVAADPTTTISVSPAVIEIDTATASNQRLGELDVEVIGFDNTYSAGKMSFTFFDSAGNQYGSTIAADFTQPFRNYFAGQSSGSSFLIRVSFPVIGDQTKIGKVQATLTNAAGSTQTVPLVFQ